MTDCHDCTKATERPKTHGGYQMQCQSCIARLLAHSPAAKEAALGFPGDLQARMLAEWKSAEQYRKGRLLVWEWVRRINEAKEQT